MTKKLRKIAVLALVPILVCMLCTPAFAAPNLPLTAKYDNDRFIVEADASISRFSTNGIVTTSSYDTVSSYHFAWVAFRYHTYDEDNPVVNDSRSNIRYSMYADVNYYNASILAMEKATYTFEVEVPTSYGIQIFNPNPFTIYY